MTFRFYISYVEPLSVVAKIIGLPGSSAGNNFVREGPVTDIVLRLSPTVTAVYFSYVQPKWLTEPKSMSVS